MVLLIIDMSTKCHVAKRNWLWGAFKTTWGGVAAKPILGFHNRERLPDVKCHQAEPT